MAQIKYKMKNSAVKRSTAERIEAGKEYKKYVSLLSEIWNTQKPLAKLFRTAQRGYIYDTGTNHIIGCDALVFGLLENFFSMDVEPAIQTFLKQHNEDKFLYAAKSIKSAIDNLNVLKFKKGEEFNLTGEKCSVDELINDYLDAMVLEVTERCNLRCAYCPYSQEYKANRSHGDRDMSIEVAEKALLHLKNHSSRQNKVGIAFYGGEPLARYEFLQHCIDKVRKLLKSKDISFSVTTNGTLITPEIARFLFKNNFSVVTSIDGPEKIHNSFRKYSSGKGSYKDSIRGLKYLIDIYGDLAEEKLKINMVYTPPFSSNRLEKISTLWNMNEWLPEKLQVRIMYPSAGTIPGELTMNNPPEDKTIDKWAFEKYRDVYNKKGKSSSLVNMIIEPLLSSVMNRTLHDVPDRRMNLNGCCVPAAKRLFVSVDGNFHLCEKIDSNTPCIGNINSGVDVETIKSKYINQYMEIAFPECSTCWAIRFCGQCFVSAFRNGKMNSEAKFRNCSIIKTSKEKYLQYFCTLLEDNPTGLDHLQNNKKS